MVAPSSMFGKNQFYLTSFMFLAFFSDIRIFLVHFWFWSLQRQVSFAQRLFILFFILGRESAKGRPMGLDDPIQVKFT